MSGFNTDPELRPGDFDGTTDDRPAEGLTGEWIVRVEGITGPPEASNVGDAIREAIESTFPHREGTVTVLFDQSRWKGGDF